MSYHPAFTPEQWERALEYQPPGNPYLSKYLGTTAIDLGQLLTLVDQQEELGAFQDDGLGVARAPLKLGHDSPAALYRITRNEDGLVAFHVPKVREVLVVLKGELSVMEERKMWRSGDERDYVLTPGQVIELTPRNASFMQPLGSKESKSFALSLFESQPELEGLVISSK